MRKKFECQAVTWALWGLAFALLGALCFLIINEEIWTLPIATLKLFGISIHLSLRMDPLSSVVANMVVWIAAIVAQFGLRYLDGERRQWYFYKYLFLLVLGVLFMVLSNNLIMLLLAWSMMSLCLNKLLLFYSDRLAAHYGARKKWIVSKIADVALLIGIILIYMGTGSFEFVEIFSIASETSINGNYPPYLAWSTFFLAVGAMAKSAQFPFHFWLPESMDAPTPVSAIMHAGVINGGGYLLLRLSPLLEHATIANLQLILVGSITATYGAIVMMTCNDIKRKLAFSTISQMGMMMFAIGLGAYVIALFHIIAHSIYKSYAFLSTGGIVRESQLKKEKLVILNETHRILVFFGLSTIWLVGYYFEDGSYLSYFTYCSILGLGLIQNIPSQKIFKSGIQIYLRVGAVLFSAICALILIESILSGLMKTELAGSQGVQRTALEYPIFSIVALMIFYSGFWIYYELVKGKSRESRNLYLKFWNDFYIGQWTSSMLRKVWPITLEKKSGASDVI